MQKVSQYIENKRIKTQPGKRAAAPSPATHPVGDQDTDYIKNFNS